MNWSDDTRLLDLKMTGIHDLIILEEVTGGKSTSISSNMDWELGWEDLQFATKDNVIFDGS